MLLQDNSKTKLRVTVTRTEGSHGCCCPAEPFIPRSFVWCCLFPGTKASLKGLSDTPQLEKTHTASGLDRNPKERSYLSYQHKQNRLSLALKPDNHTRAACLPRSSPLLPAAAQTPKLQRCRRLGRGSLHGAACKVANRAQRPSTEHLPAAEAALPPGSGPFIRVMLQLRHVTELGCLSCLPRQRGCDLQL